MSSNLLNMITRDLEEWTIISSQFVMTSDSTNEKFDAISEVLAELRAKEPRQRRRRRIGFIQNEED